MAIYGVGDNQVIVVPTADELWHEVHAAERKGQRMVVASREDVKNLLLRMKEMERALQFADNELDFHGAHPDGATRSFIAGALNYPVPVAPEVKAA